MPTSEGLPDRLVARVTPWYRAMRRYHRYRVIGLENVPLSGPGLVVFTHSLATYDIFMLGAAIYLERQRLIASLVDRLVFKLPLLAGAARAIDGVPGSPEAARALLLGGRLVGVAPGGMREALRPSSERYRVCWQGRTGFARLAMTARVPVVLSACPRADDIYFVRGNALTRAVYERFRVPLPLARGLGPTALPRPVRLTQVIDEPLWAPDYEGESPSDDAVLAFHATLTKRMEALIQHGLSYD